MNQTVCILLSFLFFVSATVYIVVTLTQNQNEHYASSIRFKFYNPLSYKTLDSEKGVRSVVNYYSNPNHSIVNEILWTSYVNDTESLYLESDFLNLNGVVPAYWNCLHRNSTYCEHSELMNRRHGVEVGPCFAPHHEVNWTMEIQKTKSPGNNILYHDENQSALRSEDWSNFCRPGFIIIGAGKCGTSSLYHYLTGHPRILPAREKQIHYFKFFPDRSLKWYFDHFPTTVSFLSNGALMTGEASPGYLPYPDVAYMVRNRMTFDLDQVMDTGSATFYQPISSSTNFYVGPKIIAVGKFYRYFYF
jgi:hypothetical protein